MWPQKIPMLKKRVFAPDKCSKKRVQPQNLGRLTGTEKVSFLLETHVNCDQPQKNKSKMQKFSLWPQKCIPNLGGTY